MVLAELATWHIRKNDPATLQHVLMRLNPDSRSYLQAKIAEVDNGRSELFIDLVFRLEKVTFFTALSGNLLLNLTRNVQEINLKEGSMVKFDPDKEKHLFSYVSKGSIMLMRGDSELAVTSEGGLVSSLPYLAVDGEGFVLKALKECTLLSLDLFTVKKFMFDYNEFALAIYYWMNDQIIHEKEFLNSIEMVS
jgi:hypothetical protein